MTLQRTTTLCLDLHRNAVDIKLPAFWGSNCKLHILVLVVDSCCRPRTSTASRSYQSSIAIDIAISPKSFVFHVSGSSITCDGSLFFVSIVHGPSYREGVAATQLNNLNSNGYAHALVALRGSHRAVILTYGGQIHLGIERLDE